MFGRPASPARARVGALSKPSRGKWVSGCTRMLQLCGPAVGESRDRAPVGVGISQDSVRQHPPFQAACVNVGAQSNFGFPGFTSPPAASSPIATDLACVKVTSRWNNRGRLCDPLCPGGEIRHWQQVVCGKSLKLGTEKF